ncbi:MAG: hypothetical protein NWF01_06730 [Candidatus Bathyarchaeota archaeon]|nr:hypothetical protein [Candidatus Bathyarchaeota archaeon]
MAETIKPQTPKFELSSHPDFKVIHVNAFFGGLSPLEGRIIFYTDILQPKMSEDEKHLGAMEVDKVCRERQIELRLSPHDFINLAEWMNQHIKRLEQLGVLKREDLEKAKQSNMPIV